MPLVRDKSVRKLKQLKRRRKLVRKRVMLATEASASGDKKSVPEGNEESIVEQAAIREGVEESRDAEEECSAEEEQPAATKKRRVAKDEKDEGRSAESASWLYFIDVVCDNDLNVGTASVVVSCKIPILATRVRFPGSARSFFFPFLIYWITSIFVF